MLSYPSKRKEQNSAIGVNVSMIIPRFSSLSSIQQALRSGTLSCQQLVEYYLEQIALHDELNAYVQVFGDSAFAKAEELDALLTNGGELPPLIGLVVSIKDIICYAGHPVQGASKILDGFESLFSATAVDRLLNAGAIIIGSTNCDEFGMGSANENSIIGPTKNAIDSTRIPGGSSGGAAVAVQIDSCLVALGSDTGGSVRQPAAFCGLVGLKPTYGRISRHGLLAYASSFDQIGFLGRNAKDVRRVLDVTGGPDAYDATCVEIPNLPQGKPKKRIAYLPKTLTHEDIDPEICSSIREHIQSLEAAGHELVPVEFPYLDQLVPTYYLLTTAEASSNLSRYDGVRYGHRSSAAADVRTTLCNSRTEGFGLEVKRRILMGAFVLSAGHFDAYFKKAQQVRRLIQEATVTILNDCDLWLLPTSPVLPWKIGSQEKTPTAAYLADIYTVIANLAGIPGISYPIGTSSAGLPIGMQMLAAKGGERLLLDWAAPYAVVTD